MKERWAPNAKTTRDAIQPPRQAIPTRVIERLNADRRAGKLAASV